MASRKPDRAAQPEAPATEFDVTPEMIEAGVKELWNSGAIEHRLGDVDRWLVANVYRAMRALHP